MRISDFLSSNPGVIILIGIAFLCISGVIYFCLRYKRTKKLSLMLIVALFLAIFIGSTYYIYVFYLIEDFLRPKRKVSCCTHSTVIMVGIPAVQKLSTDDPQQLLS